MIVEFSETAFKILKKLDGSIQKQILKYVHELKGLKDPRTRGKRLKSNLAGLWRYRIGDYRMICEIKDDKLLITVLRIGHRREIYDE
ncbi:type II toxin-antitoxin system RelE family toxin [Treponema parvum]|uniref:type II toxin-antitoxin system RelE family toxin n=1 Tax=Treponema parvum TaxID=138851 RepID=UPI001AEC51B9|nr:type II toxin-antitoxin system RelE/ParE family toxin [Treponema parvum]QTQ15772.1 type II toxin-antitoxin system RelE/ParE family toxin [Treponema parvum]